MNMFEVCDILCLCETWLRPEEAAVVLNSVFSDDYVMFHKSSMNDVDCHYSGRPFGGVGVICKVNKFGYIVSEIETSCDNFIAVAFRDSNAITMFVLVSVYMPFDKAGCKQSHERFMEVLDQLQSFVDIHCVGVPVFLCGDFNTELHPESKRLGGKRSRALKSFMRANELIAGDVDFPQMTRYTRFCHKNNSYSWLDHCLCSSRLKLTSCKITEESLQNDSDHLPVVAEVVIPRCGGVGGSTPGDHTRSRPRQIPSWKSSYHNSLFNTVLQSKLESVPEIDNSSTLSARELQSAMTIWLQRICDAIHGSANETVCVDNQRRRSAKRPFWNSELAALNANKKLWWFIWKSCGSPKQGVVFECLKNSKRKFRKLSRYSLNNAVYSTSKRLSDAYYRGDMDTFWRLMKTRTTIIKSSLMPNDFSSFYEDIMLDKDAPTSDQLHQQETVLRLFEECKARVIGWEVAPEQVSSAIGELTFNSAPGQDGVTAEHLRWGCCPSLCRHIARLMSLALTHATVPDQFSIGIIVPILKKPTLSPNVPANFRPITLSSVFIKLLEGMIMFDPPLSPTQFGFRRGMSTQFAITSLTDVIQFGKTQGLPTFLCCLDSEKCFDKLWHVGIFWKLYHVVPTVVWRFLFQLYSCLTSTVRWANLYGREFKVRRGTRQGSRLSPVIFNVFINNLLVSLSSRVEGIHMGSLVINNIAFADDITLVANTVPDLQILIDICTSYAKEWRFNFNPSKSKCLQINTSMFKKDSSFVWSLDGKQMQTCVSTEVLGAVLSEDGSGAHHISERISKCRAAFFSLQSKGMLHSHIPPTLKAFTWKLYCLPVLTYAVECFPINVADVRSLESCQGNLVKRSLGLSKLYRSSPLLGALELRNIAANMTQVSVSLHNRIFKTNSLARDIQVYFLSLYLCSGIITPGTLLDRLTQTGVCAVRSALEGKRALPRPSKTEPNGLTDSVRAVLCKSDISAKDFTMLKLLLKAF